MVGQAALNRSIGVRLPVSQPGSAVTSAGYSARIIRIVKIQPKSAKGGIAMLSVILSMSVT